MRFERRSGADDNPHNADSHDEALHSHHAHAFDNSARLVRVVFGLHATRRMVASASEREHAFFTFFKKKKRYSYI